MAHLHQAFTSGSWSVSRMSNRDNYNGSQQEARPSRYSRTDVHTNSQKLWQRAQSPHKSNIHGVPALRRKVDVISHSYLRSHGYHFSLFLTLQVCLLIYYSFLFCFYGVSVCTICVSLCLYVCIELFLFLFLFCSLHFVLFRFVFILLLFYSIKKMPVYFLIREKKKMGEFG